MTVRMCAFIRAINTGHRRLTNDQVLAPFRALGLDDVGAYQAAGNVAFRSDRDARALEVELSAALSDAFGFDAPTFVRTAGELRARVAEQPFDVEVVAATRGKTQIAFLASEPDEDQVAAAQELVPADDHVAFVGREWFWLPSAGVSDSSLPVSAVERLLGPMTMRTVGTVTRMLARFADR
jgi:uncharacterized protein (DUF1697 family)